MCNKYKVNELVGGGYCDYKHCLTWVWTPHSEPRLSADDARNILKKSKSWMLRNIYDWDTNEETNFWEVINDTYRPLEEHPSKVRNQVRRCLRDCEIRRITKYDLIESGGYNVYLKAFERYHDVTVKVQNREEWETALKNSDSTNCEYWGVFRNDDGILIAYGMNIIKQDVVSYSTLKAIPHFMNKHYPYFGLLYEMNKFYLGQQRYKYVTDGFRSITEHSNIQPFLEKNFLFRKAYCRLKIYYKWWFKAIIYALYPFRQMIPVAVVRHMLNFENISRNNRRC